MKAIITDIEQLKAPAEPLEFLTNDGIKKEDGEKIIGELTEILIANPDVLALSAPQIGINKRIFCIRFNDIIKTFINPIIKRKSQQGIIRFETNASMPNIEIAICRPKEIEVIYYTDKFKYEDNKLLGAAAAIFMQQYELLDGIIPGQALKLLTADSPTINIEDIPTIIAAEYSGDGIITEIKTDTDHFTADDINQIAPLLGKQQAYFKSIGEAIAKSPEDELQKQYRHLKFAENVINDKIQVIKNDQTPKLNRATRRSLKKLKSKK